MSSPNLRRIGPQQLNPKKPEQTVGPGLAWPAGGLEPGPSTTPSTPRPSPGSPGGWETAALGRGGQDVRRGKGLAFGIHRKGGDSPLGAGLGDTE